RIELMKRLRPAFSSSAVGSAAEIRPRFLAEGFEYYEAAISRAPDPLADVHAYGQIKRLLRKVRPSIVHTFDTKPCVWGRLAARHAGVPVVIGTITGLGSCYAGDGPRLRLLRLIYEPLQRWASKSADLTIFQNAEDQTQFTDAGIVPVGKSTVVSGSGVNSGVYDP